MGGRGASSGMGGGRTGGLRPQDILSTAELQSQRSQMPTEVDEVMRAFYNVTDSYGYQINSIETAVLAKKAQNVMAYYDSDTKNIAINKNYMDMKKMNSAYDMCVSLGYHPSRGSKSGLEATASHELGHGLTHAIAEKMGISGTGAVNMAAERIMNEARKLTSHRGVAQMRSKISGYAKSSNAEAVAESYADVYCNGSKARAESQAVVKVMNRYLK